MNTPSEVSTLGPGTPELQAKATGIQDLVDTILDCLTGAGIPYCLLRNRDLIPWGLLQWSDLDIMIPLSVRRGRLIEVLLELNPSQIVPFRDGVTYTFFPFQDLFLRVDFIHGETGWLGSAYSDNRAILAHRWNDRGIMVASPLHQAYLTWCNRLVRGGGLPERYQVLVAQAVRDHPSEFRNILEQKVGGDLADRLVMHAATGRFEESPQLSSEFRKRLWSQAFRRRPLRTLIASSKHARHGLLRRIRPSGLEVAIVGADGAAVSSVCFAFAHSPSRRIPGIYVEYQPCDVYDASSVARTVDDLQNSEAVHATPAWKPRRSAISVLIYVMGEWGRRLLRDRGKLARMVFILRDCHLLQLQIQPERFAYTGPSMVARWAGRLAPKPDLLIVLDAPPELTEMEKDLATREDLTRKCSAYRSLAIGLPYARIVHAAQPVEEVLSDIVELIREVTSSRTKQRFKGSPEPDRPVHDACSQPRLTSI